MSVDPNNQNDDALDHLLAQARWPEPTPLQQARLRASWSRLSRRRRFVTYASFATAAAAAVLITVSSIMLLSRPANPVVANDSSTGPKFLMNLPTQTSRDPNLVERLVMMQKNTPRDAKASTVQAIEQDDPLLAKELVQRVMDPATRQPALDALQRMDNPPVRSLVRELSSPLVEQRFAAARALAAVNDPSVVPTLCRMVAADVSRREALAALVLCDDPAAQQAVTAAAKSSRSIDAQLRVLQRELKRS